MPAIEANQPTYVKVHGSSSVSNPNNLICDYCINQQLANGKRYIQQQQRIKDMDYNTQLENNMEKANEEERKEHL